MSKISKKVLVVGCARSGTHSFSKMLRVVGVDAKHEKMGGDGTVSCFWLGNDVKVYPSLPTKVPHEYDEPQSSYTFKHRAHLVRHPLRCIASNISIMDTAHQKFLESLGIIPSMELRPKLLRMMYMWYNINLRLEKRRGWCLIHIENNKEVKNFIHAVSGQKSPGIVHTYKSSGNRKARPLEWSDLKNVDSELYERIRNMSERLGYKR